MSDELRVPPALAARLLRAKVGELEAYVKAIHDSGTDVGGTGLVLMDMSADIALVATLLADLIERTEGG